jgi:hypothetical protein
MEIWAEQAGGAAGGDVQFLCVCVESLGVAQHFARMFTFRHALNAYIPARQYFPHGYGQLGCSGFIVVDAKGNFISRKTRAYLQYGDQAFCHVEQLLDQERRKVASLAVGASSTGPLCRNSVATASAAAAAVAKDEEKKSAATTAGSSSSSTEDDCYTPPPSVGVHVMDDEHQACAAALKELFLRRTRAALERVMATLESHFAHEEALMVSFQFGGDHGRSEFSALNSHAKDHQRILQIGRNELQRLLDEEQRQKDAACTSTTA